MLVESISFIWACTRRDERLDRFWTCEKIHGVPSVTRECIAGLDDVQVRSEFISACNISWWLDLSFQHQFYGFSVFDAFVAIYR
jgi:hypothetical protein